MRRRWTMEELETFSDDEILKGLVIERMSELKNPYTPLFQRLIRVGHTLNRRIKKQEERETIHD